MKCWSLSVNHNISLAFQTPDEYKYKYVWPPIPPGIYSFTFSVLAANDAHVALSPTNADATEMYEIGKYHIWVTRNRCSNLFEIVHPPFFS